MLLFFTVCAVLKETMKTTTTSRASLWALPLPSFFFCCLSFLHILARLLIGRFKYFEKKKKTNSKFIIDIYIFPIFSTHLTKNNNIKTPLEQKQHLTTDQSYQKNSKIRFIKTRKPRFKNIYTLFNNQVLVPVQKHQNMVKNQTDQPGLFKQNGSNLEERKGDFMPYFFARCW